MGREQISVRMSSRLHMVADMVTQGRIVADIGTDHGYIPIHQVLAGKSPCAYACDVAEGPLRRAGENVERYGVSDRVSLILSDGLAGLLSLEPPPEAIVIAGMGGRLICRILEEGQKTARRAKELVLSPHSEIREVRQYLYGSGFHIIDENMVKEEGKFYAAIKAEPAGRKEGLDEMEALFGPVLIRNRHPVLLEFLQKEEDTCRKILENLRQNGRSALSERCREISEKQKNISNVLKKLTEV